MDTIAFSPKVNKILWITVLYISLWFLWCIKIVELHMEMK